MSNDIKPEDILKNDGDPGYDQDMFRGDGDYVDPDRNEPYPEFDIPDLDSQGNEVHDYKDASSGSSYPSDDKKVSEQVLNQNKTEPQHDNALSASDEQDNRNIGNEITEATAGIVKNADEQNSKKETNIEKEKNKETTTNKEKEKNKKTTKNYKVEDKVPNEDYEKLRLQAEKLEDNQPRLNALKSMESVMLKELYVRELQKEENKELYDRLMNKAMQEVKPDFGKDDSEDVKLKKLIEFLNKFHEKLVKDKEYQALVAMVEIRIDNFKVTNELKKAGFTAKQIEQIENDPSTLFGIKLSKAHMFDITDSGKKPGEKSNNFIKQLRANKQAVLAFLGTPNARLAMASVGFAAGLASGGIPLLFSTPKLVQAIAEHDAVSKVLGSFKDKIVDVADKNGINARPAMGFIKSCFSKIGDVANTKAFKYASVALLGAGLGAALSNMEDVMEVVSSDKPELGESASMNSASDSEVVSEKASETPQNPQESKTGDVTGDKADNPELVDTTTTITDTLKSDPNLSQVDQLAKDGINLSQADIDRINHTNATNTAQVDQMIDDGMNVSPAEAQRMDYANNDPALKDNLEQDDHLFDSTLTVEIEKGDNLSKLARAALEDKFPDIEVTEQMIYSVIDNAQINGYEVGESKINPHFVVPGDSVTFNLDELSRTSEVESDWVKHSVNDGKFLDIDLPDSKNPDVQIADKNTIVAEDVASIRGFESGSDLSGLDLEQPSTDSKTDLVGEGIDFAELEAEISEINSTKNIVSEIDLAQEELKDPFERAAFNFTDVQRNYVEQELKSIFDANFSSFEEFRRFNPEHPGTEYDIKDDLIAGGGTEYQTKSGSFTTPTLHELMAKAAYNGNIPEYFDSTAIKPHNVSDMTMDNIEMPESIKVISGSVVDSKTAISTAVLDTIKNANGGSIPEFLDTDRIVEEVLSENSNINMNGSYLNAEIKIPDGVINGLAQLSPGSQLCDKASEIDNYAVVSEDRFSAKALSEILKGRKKSTDIDLG